MRRYESLFVMLLMVVMSSGCNMQDHLLYFPDKTTATGKDLTGVHLALWKPYGDDYHGLIYTGPVESPKGTIIVFHGNAGKALDRQFYAGMFSPFGYRVILAEYPGYGGRPGKPGERSFLDAGRDALRLAFNEYGAPIYLVGESLGCGVVTWLAGHTPIPVEGIFLITPWDTLESVAREKFPSLIVSLALKDRYDSIANLKTYNKKVAIMGAGRDEIIPVAHARALYDSYAGQKRMWVIPHAGHNDWPHILDSVKIKEIIDFLSGPYEMPKTVKYPALIQIQY